ncbi:acyltransferase [Dysgonomonas sp. Marseille-P4677]|uniref:acyltransferase family protein n=1 Tax=Dysgonomonas sp. Marseille-P4677 TaxID=2364790 RepID=UPI00191379D8|nr:acyltransferase [Dysgonomonas sp. Marseille-P4677]MBK5722037.1 acyltransferase [Dysgonomonas sp. Marseille-P4677]
MERNIRLDYFKIFLSILVITIHIQPLLTNNNFWGWCISNGVSRIAVPTFFIINGFFISSKLNKPNAVKKYIIHLLLIYAVWSVIYAPYFITNVRLKDIVIILFTGYLHLWYLPGVIIGVILLYLGKRYIKNDLFILILALLSFVVGYILSHYMNKLFLYRNGFTIGFAFIVIGYYIESKKIHTIIKNSHLIIVICLTSIIAIFESYYRFVATSGSWLQDFILSTLILAPAIFILVMKYPKYVSEKGFMSIVSSGIYFLHVIAISIIGVSGEYNIYRLIPILIISALLSYVAYLINKRVKIFF